MECEKCFSERILQITAKCSDRCNLTFKSVENEGYVPSDLKIGGGDYIEIDICLQCGMAQGCKDDLDPIFYLNSNNKS